MKKTHIERISSLATRSCHGRLLLVDQALLDLKARDAADSKRKREIHSFNVGNQDTLQRMLNSIQPGSYIRPHRHENPPKAEALIILQGSLGYVPFDDQGNPIDSDFILLDVNRGTFGVDSRAGVWHCFFALQRDTVLFEVKPGPYKPETDKDFAPWAPAEGHATATMYLIKLEDRFRSLFGLPLRAWGDF